MKPKTTRMEAGAYLGLKNAIARLRTELGKISEMREAVSTYQRKMDQAEAAVSPTADALIGSMIDLKARHDMAQGLLQKEPPKLERPIRDVSEACEVALNAILEEISAERVETLAEARKVCARFTGTKPLPGPGGNSRWPDLEVAQEMDIFGLYDALDREFRLNHELPLIERLYASIFHNGDFEAAASTAITEGQTLLDRISALKAQPRFVAWLE